MGANGVALELFEFEDPPRTRRGIFHLCVVAPDVARHGRPDRRQRRPAHLPDLADLRGRAVHDVLLRGPVRQRRRALLARPRAGVRKPVSGSERLLRRAALAIPGGVNTASAARSRRSASGAARRPHRGRRRPALHRLPRRLRRDLPRPLAPAAVRRVAEAIQRRRAVRRRGHRGRVALAREDRRARAVGRAGAALQQRLGGDLPRDPARARRHRARRRSSSSRAATTASTTTCCATSCSREPFGRATRLGGDARRGDRPRRSSAASTTSTTSRRRSSARPATSPR